MSWTKEIYDIYELALKSEDGKKILPVSHSTQNAQIELTVTEDGEFADAGIIEKENAETIIPVTEDSGARSSGIAPMPFADKLVYIAGDYSEFAIGKRTDNSGYFRAYMLQLKNWSESEYSHKYVKAVYKYLEKCELMKDLVAKGVLVLDEETGKLAEKAKIAGISQADSFVRFKVNGYSTWKDKSLYDSFIKYNSMNMGNVQLCYATGKELPVTYKHPSKIRNSGDKAKLISSNDESGFTYRGRFSGKEEAISVSYEFSQKFHNALKWLIAKQGVNVENQVEYISKESQNEKQKTEPDETESKRNPYHFDSLTLVAWVSSGECLNDICDEFDYESDEEHRKRLRRFIFGNDNDAINDNGIKVMILGLDSATTGRLSISTYAEISASDYIDNVTRWHEQISWCRLKNVGTKTNREYKNTKASFSVREIANCAFGTEQGAFIKCKEEVLKETVLRLLPCITSGRKIPKDIMNALFIKASNPLSYESSFNFRFVLDTACGIIKKYYIDYYETEVEKYMAYDPTITDRSYLFGCLLAIADKTEQIALSKSSEKRATNAVRLWNSFSTRPYKTWKILEERINPYIKKDENLRAYFNKNVTEIINKMNAEDFTSTKRLEPVYLLGYHNYISIKSNTEKTEE